jgi:hypothetical protein
MGGRERALGDARDSPRIPSGRALRSCVSKPEFYSLGGPAAGDGYRRHTGAKVRHITIALRAATELKRQAAAPGQAWPVKVFGVAIKSGAACARSIRVLGAFAVRFWCSCASLQSAARLTFTYRFRAKNHSLAIQRLRGPLGTHENQAITATGTPNPSQHHQSPQPSDTSAVSRPVVLSVPSTRGQRHRRQKAEPFAESAFALTRHRQSFHGARHAALVFALLFFPASPLWPDYAAQATGKGHCPAR